MKIEELMTTARDSLTVRRVFGEPYVENGVTVIPAATLGGGGGGGAGHDEKGQEGEGGGFGMSGRPVGAYVIKNGDVQWRPAVDPNRIVTVAGGVLVALILSRARVQRARLRGGRRRRTKGHRMARAHG